MTIIVSQQKYGIGWLCGEILNQIAYNWITTNFDLGGMRIKYVNYLHSEQEIVIYGEIRFETDEFTHIANDIYAKYDKNEYTSERDIDLYHNGIYPSYKKVLAELTEDIINRFPSWATPVKVWDNTTDEWVFVDFNTNKYHVSFTDKSEFEMDVKFAVDFPITDDIKSENKRLEDGVPDRNERIILLRLFMRDLRKAGMNKHLEDIVKHIRLQVDRMIVSHKSYKTARIF